VYFRSQYKVDAITEFRLHCSSDRTSCVGVDIALLPSDCEAGVLIAKRLISLFHRAYHFTIYNSPTNALGFITNKCISWTIMYSSKRLLYCNEVWDIATKICYGLPSCQHVVSRRMQLPCRYVSTTVGLWWVRLTLVTCLVKRHAFEDICRGGDIAPHILHLDTRWQ
jgi:hypothetical protein